MGSIPIFMAISSIIFSIASMPWGPPNPLNAVFEAVFVLHKKPLIVAFGKKYALSVWNKALETIAFDKSSEYPHLAARSTSIPRILPSSA